MAISDAQLQSLMDLAFAVAPELRRSPLYILDRRQDMPTPNVVAYAQSTYCPLLRDSLAKCNRWIGPGPAIIFVKDDMPMEQLQVVLLHELSHLLPHSPQTETDPTDAERETAVRDFSEWCVKGESFPDSPLWHPGHGQEFVRIALHLWWRAALNDVVVPFQDLCCGRRYSLSPAFCYWRAIGNEPLRMRDKSFAEILATEPPAEFTEWWQADLRCWMNHHPLEVEKVRQKNVCA